MLDDDTYPATIDRITEGIAVILIEGEDEILDERYVSADELPADAREGSVVRVGIEADAISSIEADPSETERRRSRLRDRFERLSRRPPDDEGNE